MRGQTGRQGRPDALDLLQIGRRREENTPASDLVDPGGQDRPHTRQQDEAVGRAGVDRQEARQYGFRLLLDRSVGRIAADQFVQPEFVAPATVRTDQQGVANQSARCQDRDREQQPERAAARYPETAAFGGGV